MRGIYQIRNTVTGDCYIGSAVDIDKRWRWHRRRLNDGSHPTVKLQVAWNTHGEAPFAFEVLQEVDESEDLYYHEALAMREYQPAYNVARMDPDRIKASNDALRERLQRGKERRAAYDAKLAQRVAQMPDSDVEVWACPDCGQLLHLFWYRGQMYMEAITRERTERLKERLAASDMAGELLAIPQQQA